MSDIARAGTAVREVQVAPCWGCGGLKPAGQGRKFCDDCREVAHVRRLALARENSSVYYRENREKARASQRRWHAANRELSRERSRRYYETQKANGGRLAYLLAKKGLTVEQYEQMLALQGGVCAICGGVDKVRRLAVDHDHATGEIRGLLCSGCNGAKLGRLADSLERAEARAAYHEERARRLRNAIDYLTDPPARQVLGD